MKRILASSALAIVMSTSGAFADAHGDMFMSKAGDLQILGSEFIGARVYVSETDFDDDYVYADGAEREWDDVGEINNIILSRDGNVEGVVIGVGGFLGLGEKDVAVNMDQIRFISDGENANDYFLVFTSSKAALENAPEWDRRTERMRAERLENTRTALRTESNRPMTDMAALNAIERKGYTVIAVEEAGKMKASDLIGTRVHGLNNEDVGEIGDVILSPNGTGRVAVIDVGGFMGIGEKPVAIPMKELRIMRETDGDNLRVYIDATEQRLENMPEYESDN